MTERVAVVDLGSNATRLLVADVHAGGTLAEIERRSTVTRLGDRVEATGRLADDAAERVFAALADYRRAIDAHGATTVLGVLTSAVRDATNGAAFAADVAERFGIDARTIAGEEEARLTYLGATSGRAHDEPVAVIDIGGGSTEFVVGEGEALRFFVSTQVGVVRHGERHLHTDPPAAPELAALREDAAAAFAAHVAPDHGAVAAMAVGGTATQSASMLGTPHLTSADLERLLGALAARTLAQRRRLPGLDPARAPTMVAGVALLLEALAALGLEAAEAAVHDLLHGVALEHTAFRRTPPHF